MELGDADDADDVVPFRLPLPPEDRLWRHPSELGAPTGMAHGGRSARASWVLAAVSGLTGAVLTVGLLAAAGLLDGGSAGGDVVVEEAVRTSPPGAPSGDGVVRVVEATAPVIVRLEVDAGDDLVGSGVVFRDDGHVLTSAHVVRDAERITAVLDGGRTVGAHLVGADRATDVAVLKLDEPGPFRTARLGTVEGLTAGDRTIAMGSPSERGSGPVVMSGHVRAVGRDLSPDLVDMIETDAAVTPGLSGGALLDERGVIVGIVTAYSVDADGAGRSGYALPIDVARAAAEDLMHVGWVRTVWIGVRGETVAGAIRLLTVMPGSPGEAAGLRAGDVLRRVDGRSVDSMSAVRVMLRRHHPGDRIVLAYDRAGSRRSTVLVLAERPTT